MTHNNNYDADKPQSNMAEESTVETGFFKRLFLRILPGENLCPNTGNPYDEHEYGFSQAKCSECGEDLYWYDSAMGGEYLYRHTGD